MQWLYAAARWLASANVKGSKHREKAIAVGSHRHKDNVGATLPSSEFS